MSDVCVYRLVMSDVCVCVCVQAGHVCGDSMDLIDGKPTGSVRISFGFSSTLSDAEQFLRFVYECFLDNVDNTLSSNVVNSMSSSVTDSISRDVTENVTASVHDVHRQFLADKMKPTAAAAAAAAADDDDDDDVDDDGGDDDGDNAYEEVSKDTYSGPLHDAADTLQLVKIFIYPIKSCAAVQVNTSLVHTCTVLSGLSGI